MPIYAYRCASCGHELDALQKLSEPALVDCPACGAAALAKLVTAAGFQLKGSGWYQTDFRNTSKPGKETPKEAGAKAETPTATADSAAGASKGESAPASSTPSATSSGCGSGCSCH